MRCGMEPTLSAIMRWSKGRWMEWHCIAHGTPMQIGFAGNSTVCQCEERCNETMFAQLSRERLVPPARGTIARRPDRRESVKREEPEATDARLAYTGAPAR